MTGATTPRPARMTALAGLPLVPHVSFSAEVTASATELAVRARIENKGPSPLYVLNELWRIGPDGKPERDPAHAFRSLEKDTLRLLLGVPPLPPYRSVRLHLKPFATRIAPGATLDLRFGLPEPIHEYNPYFTERADTQLHDVTANAVELFVQVVTEREGVAAQPAGWPWAKDLWNVGPVFQLDAPQASEVLGARAELTGIRARRRVGEFERISRRANP